MISYYLLHLMNISLYCQMTFCRGEVLMYKQAQSLSAWTHTWTRSCQFRIGTSYCGQRPYRHAVITWANNFLLPWEVNQVLEVEFCVENVYRWVSLACLASSLMKTTFTCTVFIIHYSFGLRWFCNGYLGQTRQKLHAIAGLQYVKRFSEKDSLSKIVEH